MVPVSNDCSELLKELVLKVRSIMLLSKNMIKKGRNRETAIGCKLCGKEGQGNAIRGHIGVKHLVGVSLPCNKCKKTFRSTAIMKFKAKHSDEAGIVRHYKSIQG